MRWIKRFFLFLFLSLAFILLAYSFRFSIMRAMGNYLISENLPEPSQLMVVLSGNGFDRGVKAAELFQKGFAPLILCTGGNLAGDLKVMDLSLDESELTKKRMISLGVPDSAIIVIAKGTSTAEESDVVLGYCLQHNIKKVMLVSNKFHLRRVRQMFEKKFKANGIEVNLQGAPSSTYDENAWWETETGLIQFNNEYVKLVYYKLKH